MAPARLEKSAAVGSAAWVRDERQQAESFIRQEAEEFAFSARNELEWLNEHMAEVLAQRDFDVAEVFKTPGKLRGKTPRTARKRASLLDRAPLTDVFTSTTPIATSPSRINQFYKNIAQVQVIEVKVDHAAIPNIISRGSIGPGKENIDSGYHGTTDEELDEENLSHDGGKNYAREVTTLSVIPEMVAPSPMAIVTSPASPAKSVLVAPRISALSEDNTESALSFVSAKEDVESPTQTPAPVAQADEEINHDNEEPDETVIPQKAFMSPEIAKRLSNEYFVSVETAAALNDALSDAENASTARSVAPFQPLLPMVTADSISDSSSPARTILRKKSSLNFATLPAREPLTSKKILDTYGSRLSHHEPSRPNTNLRESYVGRLGRTSGLPVLSQAGFEISTDDDVEEDLDASMTSPEALKMPVMSSTQRLQERITMLGKSNPTRQSKSIPLASMPMQQVETILPPIPTIPAPLLPATEQDDNDDDWIGPIKDQSLSGSVNVSPTKVTPLDNIPVKEATPEVISLPMVLQDQPEAHQDIALPALETASYPQLPPMSTTPSRSPMQRKPILTAYPSLSKFSVEAVTPVASPNARKNPDGHISASKAKFYSVLKSAKGMFASTAGVSAQAKLETLAGPASRSRNDLTQTISHESVAPMSPSHVNHPPSVTEPIFKSQTPPEHVATPSPTKQKTLIKSRRSSERIEKNSQKSLLGAQKKQQIAEDLERIRDAERQKAAVQRQALEKTFRQQASLQEIATKANEATEIENKVILESEELSDRPPPPPPKTLSMAQNAAKAAELRRPTRLGEADAVRAQPAPMSIRVASQRIRQLPPSNAALGATLQESLAPPMAPPTRPTLGKKTSSSSVLTSTSSQNLKATATQPARPRALEAAARKKEQDEREAQRKAANKRELERKRAAKLEEERKQAVEQKAAEQQRLLEAKQAAQKQAAERKAETLRKAEQQRSQSALKMRADDIQSQMQSSQGSRVTAPHVNPIKPPKRFHQTEDDDEDFMQAMQQRAGASTLAHAAKRRRTSDVENSEPPSRLTNAPPVRLSTMRKEGQTKFAPSYGLGASSHNNASSMLKSAVTAQHHLAHPKTPHMNDMTKFANARIPFAEQSNLPTTASHQQAYRPAKTPATVHKSSPQYPNGESIELPDIATDSDDSDDDNDFQPPDWANSPALKELLAQQQLVDPMKVFGPIAPLMMEEVFKGNKERQAKFRARTSSANWNGPDRLTEEERRKDFEARERLERDGGWTYNSAV